VRVFIRLFSNRIPIGTVHSGSTDPISYVFAFLVLSTVVDNKLETAKNYRVRCLDKLLKVEKLMSIILKPVFD
jgi:hypothetical protein